jgi:hypothetical protein
MCPVSCGRLIIQRRIEHTLSVDIGGIRSGGDFSKCIVILCCLMCLTKLGVDADTNTHRPTEP